MIIDGIIVHETDAAKQPPPTIVQSAIAGTSRKFGQAPSDAIVLFDGTDLSNWTSTEAGKSSYMERLFQIYPWGYDRHGWKLYNLLKLL